MEIVEALKSIGFGAELVTFIVSMIPVIELRGAIPIGVYLGLPLWKAALISVVGNMVPVPVIIPFCRLVFNFIKARIKWLSGLVSKLENKVERNREKVQKGEFWGLLAFVAIPLPGTGAWTGAMIASVLNIRMKRAILPIFVGVLIAGIIICLATAGVFSWLV